MKKKQNVTWILMAALVVTLAGCKTLQETAQGEKHTTPEGVILAWCGLEHHDNPNIYSL